VPRNLVKLYRENPFHYFTHEEARAVFGIGEKAMRALVAMGAPLVAGKVNLDHFKQWLWDNRERIGKLTD
jgi:hypothetical protein